MTPVLKPYPAYKPSGVEWLGHIPAHWEVRRLKDWVTINRSVLPETTDPDFVFQYIDIGSVSTGVLTKKPQRMRFAASPSRARRIVREGDTIISTVRTYLKAVWFAQETHDNLICSTGFAVLTPDERAVPKFVSYLVQSHPFIEQVTANSVGMAYPAIAESRLGSFHLPLPPLPEQAAIARYLNYVERRIRRYIDAKQKLVGLLEELKKATIYEAVTRGLDPDVPLKPSGVEWLGHIPAHWEVRKLRNILKKVTERNQPHLPLLSVVREKGVILRDITNQDENHNFIPDDLSNYKVVYPGQFVMNKMKAWQGSYGVSRHQGIVSPAYFIFCIRDIDEDYFHVAIRSKAYVPFFAQASDGVRIGQWDLSPKRMREIPFLVPSITEQAAIAEYLDKETTNINIALNNTRREIELLQEYRTVLIADVVSGKVDVRDVAANLPDDDDIMADDSDAISEEVQK